MSATVAEDRAPMDVFEAMGTARAMRWLKPDPVPWPLLEKVIWAATRASNPNNQQPWDFVVVQDPALRSRIGDLLQARLPPGGRAVRADQSATVQRTVAGGFNLMENLADVPAVVFVCGSDVSLRGVVRTDYTDSALYAAGQNLIVAARALGLGAAFTTLHEQIEPDLRELLGIPPDRHLKVTIPIGWPARAFGPLTRKPVADVIHRERW